MIQLGLGNRINENQDDTRFLPICFERVRVFIRVVGNSETQSFCGRPLASKFRT